MKTIVYILGVDGSGKTTLSKNLVKKFNSVGERVKYLYARHIPILLFPWKLISKIFLYKRNSQSKDYEKYSEIKSGFIRRHRLLVRIYAYFWILDYLIFIWPKVISMILSSNFIIVDRYVGDVVVNISVAAGLEENEMYSLLKFLHKLFPFPSHTFFIDVDENTAFNRKEDIPSTQYLRERRAKYFMIQDFYNFEVVNGNEPIQELLNAVYSILTRN